MKMPSKNKPIVLAYLTSGSSIIPDGNFITHINYAFGTVNQNHDGIVVKNPQRLKEISALKKSAPHLHISLSIGGWTAGGFSEMAAKTQNRENFARRCGTICDEFHLDGIDLDWEFPTSSEAGIASSPNDTENFTLLVRQIRTALGEERLITLASSASARFFDFPAIIDTLDFVNIMMYDVDRPPFLHSALRKSALTRRWTCESSLDAHLDAGIPPEKLTLGLPFYGHGDKKTLPDFIDWKDLKPEEFTQCWDKEAQAPYLKDADGNIVCIYDDERSLAAKCAFALEHNLLGIMYWEYSLDDEAGTLRRTVWNAMH